MEVFQYLGHGFAVALEPMNLLYGFVGVLVGTLIGVLPGIGPPGALGILLPASYYLPPVSSMIMLSGIYYGAMYGGSTASILVNIPGEAASVVTCLDGYQMARQGRAGPALGIAAFGSFIAGTLGICGLIILAPPLASFALRFGPPEYFALMVSGLVVLSYLTYGTVIKSLMMAAIGLILGAVGNDTITGVARYTFNTTVLSDGIGFIPVVMGLFGVAEVLASIKEQARDVFKTSVRDLLPSKKDWQESAGAIARGSGMGFLLGVLPGGGAVLASFVSYALEKRISRNPENFGKGAIAGVAGPEAANNAASSGAFIPLLSLGIPSNAATAILLGALLIHGIQPGPLLMRNEPSLFWGVIASMYIGNVMLLILNLPLIGLWIKLLKVPYRLLFPVILLFCLLGVYSVNSSAAEVVIMVIFGLIGYLLRQYGFDPTPLVLALVLGPMLEVNFRQSLILSHGDLTVFFRHPISAALLLTAAVLLLYPLMVDYLKRKRRIANA
ncbi:MAG: tripartite tricarboxylate transporter permease [Betaproteobacteria bacterium]|nr:tripartite tricarboxylate transporter permease [Betaproteobacteria bacterium]MBI3054088.1 tripartite tricarboxylate transporter permease [Betaproteobacteria bacterium]